MMVKANPVELGRLFEQGPDGKPTTISGNSERETALAGTA
jgi:hypothetical protein